MLATMPLSRREAIRDRVESDTCGLPAGGAAETGVTPSIVAAYLCTIAGGAVAACALLESGAWRQARMLLAFAVTVAAADLFTLLRPDLLWTPAAFAARESCTAALALAYAVEVARRLPPRPARAALRAVLAVTLVTAAYIAAGWNGAPRAGYRSVALLDAGAGAGLACVVAAALIHEVVLADLTRRALLLMSTYYLAQAASLAPFEWWWTAAHAAQLAAGALYVLAMLATARSAWSWEGAR